MQYGLGTQAVEILNLRVVFAEKSMREAGAHRLCLRAANQQPPAPTVATSAHAATAKTMSGHGWTPSLQLVREMSSQMRQLTALDLSSKLGFWKTHCLREFVCKEWMVSVFANRLEQHQHRIGSANLIPAHVDEFCCCDRAWWSENDLVNGIYHLALHELSPLLSNNHFHFFLYDMQQIVRSFPPNVALGSCHLGRPLLSPPLRRNHTDEQKHLT